MEKLRSKFLAFLEESPKPVLADGAMGSMLHAHGVDYGHFDEVNLTKPEVVVAVHQAYIEAGAQVVMTNTFGANRYKLAEHGLEGKLIEINRAGVAHVRAAAAAAGREGARGWRCRPPGGAAGAVRALSSLNRPARLSPSRSVPWLKPAQT